MIALSIIAAAFSSEMDSVNFGLCHRENGGEVAYQDLESNVSYELFIDRSNCIGSIQHTKHYHRNYYHKNQGSKEF